MFQLCRKTVMDLHGLLLASVLSSTFLDIRKVARRPSSQLKYFSNNNTRNEKENRDQNLSKHFFTPSSAGRKYLKAQRSLVTFSIVSHNIFPHYRLYLKNTDSPVLTYHALFIEQKVGQDALQILQCESSWQRERSDGFLHRFPFRGLKMVWLLCSEDGQQSRLSCDYTALKSCTVIIWSPVQREAWEEQCSFCRPPEQQIQQGRGLQEHTVSGARLEGSREDKGSVSNVEEIQALELRQKEVL